MKRLNVGIALSGGVDSTATALLLRQEYTLTGFFMQLAQPDIEAETAKVKSTAKRLGIPLKVLDLRESFSSEILTYFQATYCQGLTPNPCMICNAKIKFGLMLDAMLDSGMDRVATGHYARVSCNNGLYHLLKGKDERKEQSYFLARLTQHQLAHVIFPMGEKIKDDIFSYVEAAGFPSFRGKESQDVCFLEQTSVGTFLTQNSTEPPQQGHIVSQDGKILGQHHGIVNYTIGQRRGLGISAPEPYYVTAIDGPGNRVIVGTNDALFKKHLYLGKLHWLSGTRPSLDLPFTVKIRYSHSGSQAQATVIERDRLRLSFQEKQRAVTPGQFAVLYRGDEVIGSGEILGNHDDSEQESPR